MKKIIYCCIYLSTFLVTFFTYAQNNIQGAVLDAEGNPLYGASIIIENTTQGTTTDQNGEFSMKTTASFPFNIVVSFIGYESQTYEVLDLNFNKISLFLEMNLMKLLFLPQEGLKKFKKLLLRYLSLRPRT